MRKQITILIVDDNEVMRKILRLVISSMQDTILVGEAHNGEIAIAMAKDLSPDIILMDINMTPVNGFEATRKILKENPAARIIGLSSHSESSYARNMMQIGAKGYLTKGVHHTAIIEAIYTVAKGNKFFPEVPGN